MKPPRLLLPVGFALFITTISSVAQVAERSEKDDQAIRANVAQMGSRWNSKKAVGFATNADYVVNNGMHIKNFPSNAGGLQRLFDTVEKGSHVTYTVDQIRFLRKDVAVVHIIADMKDAEDSGQGRITLVMTKEKGKWTVASFQNTGNKAMLPR
jgi:uncharacterized protein (TIGR02246 family)